MTRKSVYGSLLVVFLGGMSKTLVVMDDPRLPARYGGGEQDEGLLLG
jgi:hypothetical protein